MVNALNADELYILISSEWQIFKKMMLEFLKTVALGQKPTHPFLHPQGYFEK